MPKAPTQPDVLVLGSHPAAYFAATLLREDAKVSVLHAAIPGEQIQDRLVFINPAFFELHKLLAPLKKKLDLQPVYGVRFLANESSVSSEYVGKSIVGYVGSFLQIQQAMVQIAQKEKVTMRDSHAFEIESLDEGGAHLRLDDKPIHPKLIVLGGDLPEPQMKMLGAAESWEQGVLHRYTYLMLNGEKWVDDNAKPMMPMSLDLKGQLCWGWLLRGQESVQVCVEQPLEAVGQTSPAQLLDHWIDVLVRHGELKTPKQPDVSQAVSIDLPLTGALNQEGVANRTLLVGPAGGFYTACAEDIYPNCWSAIFAADVAKKALKERHVQDSIQVYRQKWGTTLGDYLRGPQQNLRFLLPLVYRNPVMTSRLAEAILSGKSVVR
jgi:flavin-dependent dehydrogenase